MSNTELVKKWYGCIDNQDFDMLATLMSPEHKFHNPLSPVPSNVQEHLGMAQMMTAALKGEHIMEQVVEGQDTVVVRGRWTGTHVGEFNGVPASGNDVSFSFMDLFEIENGQVTNEYLEMNPATLMQQIGAM